MVQIRYATPEDYELILTIDESISINKWKEWTENKQAVLTFINNEFAGWLQYSLFIEKIPFVNRLYIFEKHQKKCLGTGLMKFWEFEMVEKGHTRLILSTESDNTAKQFYEKLGYRVLGDFDYFGEHCELMMGKTVSLDNKCPCQNK